ncbi:MAG TPA: hypothetical protein VLV83_23970 [Acidobacteriota bacterium]|nr:hypothetical protein [Acidobacteriota bacterium]
MLHLRTVIALLVVCSMAFLGTALTLAQDAGLVVDEEAGLIWFGDGLHAVSSGTNVSPVLTRPQALRFIAAMNSGGIGNLGFSDWRLPSTEELRVLAEQTGPRSRLRGARELDRYFMASLLKGGSSTANDRIFAWPVRAAERPEPPGPPAGPPTASPQTIKTEGAESIEILLEGSDPEGGDLEFFIEEEPRQGGLFDLTPIVPDPIQRIDPDTGKPTGEEIQPPIVSATVTYRPFKPSEDAEDRFVFGVTDREELTGTATVVINPFEDPGEPPPPIDKVVAIDAIVETTIGVSVVILLEADAPEGTSLAYALLSLPREGRLTDSSGEVIGDAPVELRDNLVVYMPPEEFTGREQFDFQACGSVGGVQQCSKAIVDITVNRRFELAEDLEVTTLLNQPVEITLRGNPGGTGTPEGEGGGSSPTVLSGALVAGTVFDSDGDGRGDGADELPGSEPLLVAAVMDRGASARIQMEWDIRELSGEIESASVLLNTEFGGEERNDTAFFAGLEEQDGALRPSDFEAQAEALAGAVMPVPEEARPGEPGTFSFDVTQALRNAIASRQPIFSVQGRLSGKEDGRGLQVRSSAIGNIKEGLEPQLEILTTEPANNGLIVTITELPRRGALIDPDTGERVSLGQEFLGSKVLVYTPARGFSGEDVWKYQVQEAEFIDAAFVVVTVLLDDGCSFNGRPPGCHPDN